MSFFEDTLCHLSHWLKPEAQVICGYQVKYQSKTSFELLEKYIGKTSTSLAKKKARLIFSTFQRSPVPSPYPLKVIIEGFPIPWVNHSGVFSREKLDIGTRFFLENIPTGDFRTILDLGCGNGIIGIAAQKLHPEAKLIFSDDSAQAIESARTNYANYFPKTGAASPSDPEFIWTNAYEGQPAESLDLVLCNPPFHQGNAMDSRISDQMFRDAYHALKQGGTLRVIGNHHLNYHLALKNIFGASQIIASNPKFKIVDAIKAL